MIYNISYTEPLKSVMNYLEEYCVVDIIIAVSICCGTQKRF